MTDDYDATDSVEIPGFFWYILSPPEFGIIDPSTPRRVGLCASARLDRIFFK
jgi:hypothetical protein